MISGDQVVGQVDGSLHFDGLDDLVNTGSAASLDNHSAITLEAWINPAGWGEDPTYGYGRVLDKGTRKIYLVSTEDGFINTVKFAHQFSGNDGTWFATTNVLSLDSWAHVVVTYDSSSITNVPTFYVNGQPLTSTVDPDIPGGPTGAADPDGADDLLIGNTAAGDRTFNGIIDEARYSSVIRTAAWIETEFNNQSSPATFHSLGGEELNGAFCGADPATSTITAAPISISADGASTSTITVQLKDSFGNNLTAGGDTVLLNTTLGSLGSVTDNLDGTYTATLTAGVTPGTATVTGTVNAAPITDDATVDFTGLTWVQCDFAYRKQITIQASQVTADLTNFPVLISLPFDWELAANAQNDGDDIVFTSSDGLTKLSHEIEFFDGATGELAAWVNVPSVSSTVNTVLYMYYGNPTSGDQSNPSGVWDADFEGVWHLQEDASGTGTADLYQDSTLNARHGDDNVSATDKSGRIGAGQQFDDVDDIINNIPDPNVGSAITVGAWINLTNISAETDRFVTVIGSAVLRHDGVSSPGQLDYYVSTGGTNRHIRVNSSLSAGAWYYVVGTWDGTTQVLYKDGAPIGSATPGGTLDADTGAHFSSNSEVMDGSIDEVRVSSVARSADWIETEFNNQSAPASFYTVGSAEDNDSFCGGGGAATWWDCDFDYRMPITVSAGTAAVPAAYSVSITIDHAALVGAGKSLVSGDDVRILYWNGSWWEQADRYLDPGSSWNSASTRLWFQTRAAIAASGSDANYAVYYGNPAAGSPSANPDSVFLHYDGFETGDLSRWDGTWTGAGDTFSVVNTTVRSGTYAGRAVVDAGTVAAAMHSFPAVSGLHTTAYYYLPAGWDSGEYVALNEFRGGSNLAGLTIGEPPNAMVPYVYNEAGGGFYFSDTPITTGSWYRLEMKFLVSPTSGRAELWVNGVQKVNQTSIDTGSSNIDTSFAGIYWRPSLAGTAYVDDTFDRLYVGAEPTAAPAAEEGSGCSASPTGPIYYSVGTDSSALYSGNASASNGTLTLASAAANSIGVGDEIRQGANRYYITGRNSSTEFTIQNSAANGGTPGATNITFGSTAITIYRAFNLLSAAEAGASDSNHLNSSDLVAGNKQLMLAAYNDGAMNDGAIVIDGWTTGAANYLRIFTPTSASEVGASQRHDGTAGSGFRLVPTADGGGATVHIVDIMDDYVRIEGVEFDGSNVSNARWMGAIGLDASLSPTAEIHLDQLVLHDLSNVNTGSPGGTWGIIAAQGSLRISNSLIYDLDGNNNTAGSQTSVIRWESGNTGTSYIHNLTIYDAKNNSSNASAPARGLDVDASTVYAKNVAIFDVISTNGSEASFRVGAGATLNQSNNVSSDATAVGVQNRTGPYGIYFADVTAGSEDLHLLDSSNALWGSYGADLDGDANLPVSQDMDGEARDASQPDIGADEFTGTPAAPLTVNSTGDGWDFSPGDGVCETAAGNHLCTLRAAVQEGNFSAGLDDIEFSIPTTDSGYNAVDGWWTISLTSALPDVTDNGLQILGLTQTANRGDTNPGLVGTGGTVGVDAEPLPQYERPEIAIDANGFDGFALAGSATDILIEGLSIYDGDNGILARGGAGTNRTVRYMFIGPLPDGSDPGADRNQAQGIRVDSPASLTVTSSYIGYNGLGGITGNNDGSVLTVTYNEVFSNDWLDDAHDGIDLNGINGTVQYNLSHDNRNMSMVPENDSGSGIELGSQSAGTGNNLVDNNTLLDNLGAGITIRGGPSGNTITNNILSGNEVGVAVNVETSGQTDGNTLSQNRIYGNTGLGIDLHGGTTGGFDGVTANDAGDGDTGSNQKLNFPVIYSANLAGGNLTVTGEARSGATVEFFEADGDASGYGEGQTFVASKVEGSGDDSNGANGTIDGTARQFTFTFAAGSLILGDELTATATDAGGNTSEFALNVTVTSGSSLQFDGVDDRVLLVDLPTWTEFTIELWAKRTADTSDFASIVSDANAGYTDAMFTVYVDFNDTDCPGGPTDEFAYGQMDTSAWDWSCSGVGAALGTWFHLAVTRDAPGNLRYYVGGNLVDGPFAFPAPPASTGTLRFGRAGDEPSEYFAGLIDEVRLSNIARYTGASFTPPTAPLTSDANTVGLWHLDEGTGQVVDDSSSNNRDGVLGTTSSPEPSDPTWSTDTPVVN
jgi:parallel beta-helix repeat protein